MRNEKWEWEMRMRNEKWEMKWEMRMTNENEDKVMKKKCCFINLSY